MLKILVTLWHLVPAQYRLAAAIGAAVLLTTGIAGAGTLIWIKGDEHGVQITAAKYEAQIKRIEANNAQAVRDANGFYQHALDQARAANQDNDHVTTQLDQAAAAAPADAPVALHRDSLQQLSRIH